MQHLEVSGAVRPLKWSLGVKWLSVRVWSRYRGQSALWLSECYVQYL